MCVGVKLTGLRNLRIFGFHFKVIIQTSVEQQTDCKNKIQRQREIVNKKWTKIQKKRKKRKRKGTEREKRKEVYKENIRTEVLHKMGEKSVVC